VRSIATIRRGCLWGLIGLALVIALVPFQGIIWDGGFPSIECRLKFVDSSGTPVPGVTLTVRTRAGGTCHFYPVDEFVPDHPVSSDAEGRMVFHHSGSSVEFSGHEYHNLIGFRFGETSAPHYDCVFTLHGREVFRCPFNFYQHEWDEFEQPSVTRVWHAPWDVNKYGWHPDEDYHAWRMRLFDTNNDGTLDREERTAAGFFERTCGYFEPTCSREMKATEIKFRVVERTITVPAP